MLPKAVRHLLKCGHAVFGFGALTCGNMYWFPTHGTIKCWKADLLNPGNTTEKCLYYNLTPFPLSGVGQCGKIT